MGKFSAGEREFRVDPVELSRLAADVLAASGQLVDAWSQARDGAILPPEALGNSGAAARVVDAYTGAASAADLVICRQIGVLEDDVDRLYQVAFAYEKTDIDARAAMLSAGGAPGLGGS